jgi:two-component system LytT family response regulator
MVDDAVRAMIVDDEPVARDAVRALLAEHAGIRVVGEAANGRDATAEIRRLKPDLLFLDIQMPDVDGFDVLQALGADVPPGVAFVTAHDRHAVRAFEVHALDYVLVASVDWVEASGDHARIHSGSRSWVITQRMHTLERLLSRGDFLRIHRSLIVNLERVRELHRDADGAGTVVLTTGVRLRVARARWDALQKALRMASA